MKNNKSKKIFILAMIVIVLILIVGVVYAMFATNIFKSNKDLFFKYAGQIFDNENGFIDNKLLQYNDKKQSSVYEHEGKLTTNENDYTISFAGNIDNKNSKVEELIKLNYSNSVNFPIMYKKVNSTHALKFNDISKRYFGIDEKIISGSTTGGNISVDDSVVNKAKIAKIKDSLAAGKDVVAMKVATLLSQYYQEKYINNSSDSESIGKRVLSETYICEGVEILTDLTQNGEYIGTITINNEENPECYVIGNVSEDGKINWEDMVVNVVSQKNSKEEDSLGNTLAEQVEQNKYLSIIQDSLEKTDFTKVTTSDGEGYSLKISNEKLKEILVKLLDKAKDDDKLVNQMNNLIQIPGMTDAKVTIEGVKNSIESLQIEDGSTTITVYQSKEKLNKIEIQYNDEFKIVISKTSNEDGVSYEINFENQTASVDFKATYAGLKTLEDITENIEIAINSGKSLTYNIENKVSFANSNITISNFSSNELIDVVSLSSEKQSKLLQTILKGIIQVNTKKMEEVGIKGDNPFLTMVPGVDEVVNSLNIIQESEMPSTLVQEENKSNNTENKNNDTSKSEQGSSSLVDGMEKVTKESFNEKFKQYEGNNVKGATVKSLIMQVIANNMIDDGRKIEVTGDIKLTGNEVPDSVESSKFYVVKCSTDSEGYVNKVDIKVK